jgi:hypothetical protein
MKNHLFIPFFSIVLCHSVIPIITGMTEWGEKYATEHIIFIDIWFVIFIINFDVRNHTDMTDYTDLSMNHTFCVDSR